MRNLGFIVALVFAIGRSAFGDLPDATMENDQLIIKQNPTTPYQSGDLICVKMPDGGTACGKITSAGSDVVQIELNPTGDGVEVVGEKTAVPAVSPIPSPAAPTPSPSATPQPPKKKSKKKTPLPSPTPSPSPSIEPSPTPIASPPPIPTPEPPPPMPELSQKDRGRLKECPPTLERVARYEPPRPQKPQFNREQQNAIGLGTNAGLQFYTVGPVYERRFDEHWHAQGTVFYSKGSTAVSSLSTWGFQFRAMYFLQKDKDFYLAGFGGYYSVSSEINSSGNKYSLNVLALGGSAGYRVPLAEEWSLGLELGAQQNSQLSGNASQIDFVGVFPSGTIQVFYHF